MKSILRNVLCALCAEQSALNGFGVMRNWIFVLFMFIHFFYFRFFRIAAQTNAQRVCAERGWEMGTVVGYQVGSDQQANCSPDTRILFCTTGVLLEKLIHSKTLYHYTHIILDEVHERTKEMDFLMIIVYKFLVPSKKVILMSATIDSEKVIHERLNGD